MADPLHELMASARPRTPEPMTGPTLAEILSGADTTPAQQPPRQLTGRAGAATRFMQGVDRFMNEITGSKPAYAEGGRPPVGQPAVVGENGPEVFVPDQPGTIIPNHELPLWLQTAMTQLPEELAFLREPGLAGYEQYDPNTLAAMRMQRGARVPVRYQLPPAEGMTTAEVGDAVYRAAFGQPDATIPQALSRPPSTWTPEEADYILRGTTEAGLMATPAAMAKPITSIANTALDIAKAAPKTTGATAGTSAVLMTSTEASDKASDFRGRAAELEPEITQLRSRIETNQNKLLQLSTTQVAAGRTKAQQKQATAQSQRLGTGTTALNEALTQDRSRLKELEGQRDRLQAEALAAEARGRPLTEQYPWTKYGPVVGGLIAGATALDPRLRAVREHNKMIESLGNAVRGVEAAAARTGTNVTNADRLALEQLRAYQAAIAASEKTIKPTIGRELAEGGKAAVPGAFVGAELGMLPSQIDLVSQGKETPAYQAAVERFTTWPGWAKTGLNAFVGATGGTLGAGTPTSWYGARPAFADVPRAQAAEAAYLARQSPTPRASSPGSTGPGSPTSPAPSTRSSPSAPPSSSSGAYFNSSSNRWHDAKTGDFVPKPIDEILKNGKKKR